MHRTLTFLSMTFVVGLSELSSAQDEIPIFRTELPSLRGYDVLAITGNGGFAVAKMPDGSLAQVNVDTGEKTSIPLQCPKRRDLVRTLPNSDAIVFYNESAHCVDVFDTRLCKKLAAVALPEQAETVIANSKIPVGPAAQPKFFQNRLREIQPSGLWISPTGKAMVIGFHGHEVFINLPQKKSTAITSHTLGGAASCCGFSSDDTAVVICATGGLRGVSVVDLTTYDRIFDVEGFEIQRQKSPKSDVSYYNLSPLHCTRIAWTSNDSIIVGTVYTEGERSLHFWDGTTGRLVAKWSAKCDAISSLAFLPDGQHCLCLISLTKTDGENVLEKKAVIIELKSGKQVGSLPLSFVSQVSLNQSCVCDAKGNIYVFDAELAAFKISSPSPLRKSP